MGNAIGSVLGAIGISICNSIPGMSQLVHPDLYKACDYSALESCPPEPGQEGAARKRVVTAAGSVSIPDWFSLYLPNVTLSDSALATFESMEAASQADAENSFATMNDANRMTLLDNFCGVNQALAESGADTQVFIDVAKQSLGIPELTCEGPKALATLPGPVKTVSKDAGAASEVDRVTQDMLGELKAEFVSADHQGKQQMLDDFCADLIDSKISPSIAEVAIPFVQQTLVLDKLACNARRAEATLPDARTQAFSKDVDGETPALPVVTEEICGDMVEWVFGLRTDLVKDVAKLQSVKKLACEGRGHAL